MTRPAAIFIILIALGLASAGLFHSSNIASRLNEQFDSRLAKIETEHDEELAKAQSEGGGNLRAEGELMERVSYLEEQLTLYQTENARLLKTIDQMVADGGELPGAPGEAMPEKDPEEQKDLRGKVEELTAKLRKLDYKAPVTYETKDWDGMRELIESNLRKQFGKDDPEGKRQSRAFASVGFIKPGVDLLSESANLLTNQNGIALYDGGSKIVMNKDASTKSIHDRTALSIELARTLQDQNFGHTPVEEIESADMFTAMHALTIGDANLVKVRFMLQDTFPTDDNLKDSPTAMSKQDFDVIPAFVREYFLFPYTMGMNFCQVLHEKNGWESVNMAHARPPRSTAQILHPELYISDQQFEPVAFDFPVGKMEIKGELPLWDNTAGELGISVLLNQSQFLQEMRNLKIEEPGEMPVLSPGDYVERPGSKAASGWRGDRCIVYSAGEGMEGKDHYAWFTAWGSEEDAIEFFNAMKSSLRFRYDSEANSEPGSEEFVIADDKRHVRMIRDKETHQVHIFSATDADWQSAMQAAFE